MTLEELQAEFPHGSRWLAGLDKTPFTVCGWSPELPPGALDSHGNHPRIEGWDSARHGTYRNSWEPSDLRPLPAPCPITEPTTLWPYEDRVTTEVGWASHTSGATLIHHPLLTLHPAEPGATEGRYTWGRPS